MEPSEDNEAAAEEERERAAEDVRSLGMRKWAKVAFSAHSVRSTEMLRLVANDQRFRGVSLKHMRGSEYEEIAIEIVRWLALLFIDGRAPPPEEIEILRRMAGARRIRDNAAPRGNVTARTIARAVEIVEYHAQRFIELESVWTPPPDMLSWSPRQELANALTVELYASVHEGFDCIVPESSSIRAGTLPAESGPRDIELLDTIAGWLERYEAGREPRTGRGSDEGKLTAARILEKLNTLSGSPLGENLNADLIGDT
jgi:hypothetical protein